MKNKWAKRQKLFVLRFLLGQLPALAVLGVLFSGEFFKLSVGVQFAFGFLFLANIGINVYFMNELKQVQQSEATVLPELSPMVTQLLFIGLLIGMGGFSLFRGLTAPATYQQTICYVCAVICFVLAGLLVWSLTYMREAVRKK